jgi:arsenate reductase
MPDARTRNVLFLCTGNAGRSIIAEAILNRLGAPAFRAFSAGSQPRPAVNPAAIRLLTSLNYETQSLRPKSWDEFAHPDAPPLHVVITVCDSLAAETCPVWPGHPRQEHWDVADPTVGASSEAELDAAFAGTHEFLHDKISTFLQAHHRAHA